MSGFLTYTQFTEQNDGRMPLRRLRGGSPQAPQTPRTLLRAAQRKAGWPRAFPTSPRRETSLLPTWGRSNRRPLFFLTSVPGAYDIGRFHVKLTQGIV